MSNYQNSEINSWSSAFKALSNPNRLQIFLQLLDCCDASASSEACCVPELCVGELGENLDVAPSTLSHHIKELQRAGLIKTERQGQHVSCQVDPDMIQQLKRVLER